MQDLFLLFNLQNCYFAEIGLPVNLPVKISHAYTCVNEKVIIGNLNYKIMWLSKIINSL